MPEVDYYMADDGGKWRLRGGLYVPHDGDGDPPGGDGGYEFPAGGYIPPGEADFDPTDYPFDLLFPMSPNEVGIYGVGLAPADLTVITGTTWFRPPGRNDGNVVSNPSAAGTEADPFIIEGKHVKGQLGLDSRNRGFSIVIRESKIDGNPNYGIYSVDEGTGNPIEPTVEDCEVGDDGGYIGNACFAGSAPYEINRVFGHHMADFCKLSPGVSIDRVYSSNLVATWNESASDYQHGDFVQFGDGNFGSFTVRRSFADGGGYYDGGPNDGNPYHGNFSYQSKPSDGRTGLGVFADCYLASGNSCLTLLGFNSDDATYEARRLILQGHGGGHNSGSWNNGTPIRTDMSGVASGPDTVTRIYEQVRHFDGSLLYDNVS